MKQEEPAQNEPIQSYTLSGTNSTVNVWPSGMSEDEFTNAALERLRARHKK